ncbi:MAG: hypothetical protein AAGH42_05565 [Pseudomonadota bacterium]
MWNCRRGDNNDNTAFGDLEPIHAADHPGHDPKIGQLSDDNLKRAITEPKDSQYLKVKGNRLFDGNTGVNEAKRRGFNKDWIVPVIDLEEEGWL